MHRMMSGKEGWYERESPYFHVALITAGNEKSIVFVRKDCRVRFSSGRRARNGRRVFERDMEGGRFYEDRAARRAEERYFRSL